MTRAVVLTEPGHLEVRSVAPPTPGPGEVVVSIAWVGICGSDVDLRDGHRPAPYARYPIVPGHEWSGTVAAVGAGVDPALVDQPVVGENIRPCALCAPCQRGDSPACDTQYEETGFTIDGAWADLLVVPAALLHPLPVGADLRSAAGIEPTACAAAALRLVDRAGAKRVAIVGGGTIGLLCAQLTRQAGTEITVIDPDSAKANLARRCGADVVADPHAAAELDSTFDLVFEAAGVTGSATLAAHLARRGGHVVLCGLPPIEDTMHTLVLISKGLNISTVFGASRAAWRDAVDAFVTRRVDPGLLVTHELPLDEASHGLELVAGRTPGMGKVLLRP
jgi:threonine dehydrogenase-like Zn-dependent dehydrogenase